VGSINFCQLYLWLPFLLPSGMSRQFF